MKTFISLICCIILISLFNMGFSQNPATWQKMSQGIYESDIRALSVNLDESSLYIGTNKAVYEANLAKGTLKRLLQLGGSRMGVNDIFISPENSNMILAATDDGVYQTINAGKAWKKIFSSSDVLSQSCQSIVEYKGILYVGTLKGLFEKDEGENTWSRVKGEFLNSPIYKMKLFEDKFYFATGREVFEFVLEDQSARQIFSLGTAGVSKEDSEEFDEEESWDEDLIKEVQLKDNNIFIATVSGLFYRNINAFAWTRLPCDAVPIKSLTSLCVINFPSSHGEIQINDIGHYAFLVSTQKGGYFYKNGEWSSIYKGMETKNMTRLLLVNSMVYAATDRGLFFLPVEEAFADDKKGMKNLAKKIMQKQEEISFEAEPTIQEVHQMAIDYAEVSPEKIKKWRDAASKKAWLPDLSVSSSWDKNRTTSDSVWGSYTSGGQYYVGPNDHTYYRNREANVSLSWDLGDVIWSSDQTSIDSRSKMMVELRGSILDQVTRLYFERRRVQIEAMSLGNDTAVQMDLNLRTQELTALIDSLTGGKFSREIERRKIAENNQMVKG